MSLGISGGNVLRACRETGVPQQTVRNWKKKWDVEGGPNEGIADAAESKVIPGFVKMASTVRDEALKKIHELLPKTDVKDLAKLATIVGIMDDKVRLASGLATSRKEVQHSLPSPEEMRALGKGYAAGAISAALERDEAIIDAEVVQQVRPTRSLPSPLHD
jgi:transposase-like protein